MEEIFDAENYTVRYDKDSNSAVVIWKHYDERDGFRTPLMHAAEIIRKHGCEALVVDRSEEISVSESDKKWAGKVLASTLYKNGCRKIVLVGRFSEEDSKSYPISSLSGKFTIITSDNMEDALRHITPVVESEEILNMSVREALDYMGLPFDANDFAIDEKFWQLSKRLRNDKDMPSDEKEKKLSELSAVYDIATGRRDERKKADEKRENDKKFMGKTGDEWRNHFSYSWYKYVIAIVLAIAAGSLIYNIFLKPKTDCGVLSLGHFKYDSTFTYDFLIKDLEFKNPYIGYVDVVVPNDENQRETLYSEQSATVSFYSRPNVLITDIETLPYFFDETEDMSVLYRELESVLSPSQMEKIEPVYMSEREAYLISYEYEKGQNMESLIDTDVSDLSTEKVMIGIAVYDEEYIHRLGYFTYWKQSDPSIVFSICSEGEDNEISKKLITEYLKQL